MAERKLLLFHGKSTLLVIANFELLKILFTLNSYLYLSVFKLADKIRNRRRGWKLQSSLAKFVFRCFHKHVCPGLSNCLLRLFSANFDISVYKQGYEIIIIFHR